MEDSAIIDLYWARADAAVQETQRKYGPYCHRIAYGILASREDAEECVNDTWLRAWNAIPPQRPDRLSAFLGRLTRNLALDRWKRDHAEKRGGGETALALSELEGCLPAADPAARADGDGPLAESLDRFLAGLRREQRRVFLMRYWHLTPVRDIAARTGYTESKVAAMLHHLRGRLKAHLEREGIAV